MFKNPLAAQRKSMIEDSAKHLFSQGTLGSQTTHADTLSRLPGLDLFITAVPWSITVSPMASLNGFSENLYFAAKDILAHLTTIAKSAPPETPVTVNIDVNRLSKAVTLKRLHDLDGGN